MKLKPNFWYMFLAVSHCIYIQLLLLYVAVHIGDGRVQNRRDSQQNDACM